MSGEVYELLLRHPHLLNEKTLIIGAEASLPSGWLGQLQESGCTLNSWDLPTTQACAALGDKSVYGLPQPEQLQGFDTVILLWPKAKQLGLTLVSLIAASHNGCYVAGANDSGGKSIGKACKDLAEDTEKVDSARHCSLWHLQLKEQNSFNWLKFAASFSHNGNSYMTLPGVFNHGSLDKGTAILLEHVPAPAHGRLLDLGCGSGVIGLSMKAVSPALEVTLADIDAMAIRSAQLNSARLNLAADIIASDGLNNIDGRFDYIFSNPPFHQGKQTDYEFARRLFSESRQHLTADGQLWIVANRHLAYQDLAAESFAQVELMAQEQGFKLICAQLPK